MALIKKHWRTTLGGIACILAGIFDLLQTRSLNQNNIVAFGAGWALLEAADAQIKK